MGHDLPTWRLRGAFASYVVTRYVRAAGLQGAPRAHPEVLVGELDEWLRRDRPKLQAMLEELHGAGVHQLALPRRGAAASRDPLRARIEAAFRTGALVGFELIEPRLLARSDVPLEKAPPGPEPEPTWFELRVLWEDTGDAVSGLPIVLQPSEGGSTMRETDSDGRIRLENIYGTMCEARSKWDGLTLADVAAFVGTGEPPVPEDQRGKGPTRRAPRAIAGIERHKVRDGETLETVAGAAGLTWQQLAKFNWGTDDPKAINRHLANDVGCTRRTQDRKNYLFSGDDHPGILFVPRPWRLPRLGVAAEHVLRIRHEVYPQREFEWSM